MLNFGSSFGKNAKGFTLFTALVGFIVIAIGLLVIQHMNNSEANYNQIIIGMQSQSEMEAIKDFLRLEAFNVFNILLRAKVYQYFNTDCGSDLGDGQILDCTLGQKVLDSYSLRYDVYNEEQTLNIGNEDFSGMDAIHEDFEHKVFFREGKDPRYDVGFDGEDNPFANYLAINIASNLQNFEGVFRNYYRFRVYDPSRMTSNLDLTNPDSDPTVGNANLSKFLGRSISYPRANSEDKKMLRIIDCGDNDCKTGTFYITADFMHIDDAYYFNIPRMFLYNQKDFSTLDDAIVPKMQMLFYIPFRLFGAMDFAYNKVKDVKPDLDDLANENFGTVKSNVQDPFSSSDVITSCSINNYDYDYDISLYRDPNFEDVCNQLLNYEENNFKIIDCNAYADSYESKTFILSANVPSQPTTTWKKMNAINLIVTILDTSPNYMFGNTELRYPFKVVFNYEPTFSGFNNTETEKTCSCTFDSSNQTYDC